MRRKIGIEQFLSHGEPVVPPSTSDFVLLIRAAGVLPEEMEVVGAVEMMGVRNRGISASLGRRAYSDEISCRMKQLRANRYAFLDIDALRDAKEGDLGDIGRLIRHQTNYARAVLFSL